MMENTETAKQSENFEDQNDISSTSVSDNKVFIILPCFTYNKSIQYKKAIPIICIHSLILKRISKQHFPFNSNSGEIATKCNVKIHQANNINQRTLKALFDMS